MPNREIITSDKAPKAIGPYSVANRFGELVFCSGQTGLDPATGKLVPGGLEAETRQVLTNLKNVLEASGSSMENVLKTTVYIRDMADFAKLNAIYAEFFPVNPPARTTIAVAGLPLNGVVEIEAIACRAS
jgi:2-iminobutanoate/2-iminopropanoate deaminase